jgi:hypothetical protein
VVTAAAEELVRMVVSDPRYGLNIRPEHVIGARLLLYEPSTRQLHALPLLMSSSGFYGPGFDRKRHDAMSLTRTLLNPASWYEGKRASIRARIHEYRRPILVAGDSPNDYAMLSYVDPAQGGVRFYVKRDEHYQRRMKVLIAQDQVALREAGLSPNADRGWLIATSKQLHCR